MALVRVLAGARFRRNAPPVVLITIMIDPVVDDFRFGAIHKDDLRFRTAFLRSYWFVDEHRCPRCSKCSRWAFN